jgi:predicted alpha/beta hydrolase family esterase
MYKYFYELNEILYKFKNFCKKSYCVYSDNDPYVSEEKAKEFAKIIDSEEVKIENMGHFSITEVRELIDYIKK